VALDRAPAELAGHQPPSKKTVALHVGVGGLLLALSSLARAWPDARLIVVDDAGHTGSNTMRDQIRDALDGFA